MVTSTSATPNDLEAQHSAPTNPSVSFWERSVPLALVIGAYSIHRIDVAYCHYQGLGQLNFLLDVFPIIAIAIAFAANTRAVTPHGGRWILWALMIGMMIYIEVEEYKIEWDLRPRPGKRKF